MHTTAHHGQALRLSFEFFPPNSADGTLRLWRSVERLAPLAPRFVSVTYGAGGSTRQRTNAAIRTIIGRARLDVAGHLTCVGASRDETLAVARAYARMGVRRIVALRGDPPRGASKFEGHPQGYGSAADLVAGLRATGDFDISVAAYPETHPEAASPQADIETLRRKLDAGANRAITQFFFEAETFLRYRDRCARAGITAPIVPGILPVEDFDRMKGFAARCAASVPHWMPDAFRNARTPEQQHLLAVAIATELCDTLRSEGVRDFHFYTLNNPDLCYDIARALGVQPAGLSAAAGQVA